MLPATLVTFTTFLLELCNSSPVYNMQPAFITNTVGVTTGRNIRNLPCISRRNSNQSGFCMFAIDCLKANGTHLGTCIDGFYFGSCCHIEPVHEIIDNSIDTDILPHREPPFRISSTTMKISTASSQNESTTLKISSSTTKNNIVENITTSTLKPIANSTVSEKVSVSQTTPHSTTISQKLQTFQLVEEVSTKASTSTTNEVTKRPVPVTKEPVTISSTRIPVTKEPVPAISTQSTKVPSRTTTTKPTNSTFVTFSSSTTEKSQLVTLNKSTTTEASKEKPSKPTKIPPSKNTSKPIKISSKPSRITTTTKKPDLTPTKSQTTAKPTKKINSSSKPTKATLGTSTKVPTRKPIKVTSSTVKVTTSNIITTSSRPQTTTTTIIKKSNTSSTTTSPITILTTHNPNNLTKINASQVFETVNGNLATNEIEGVDKPTTIKPGLITWIVDDNRNATTPSPFIGDLNVTTEDWVPITTPDGWVLLPSVGSNLNQSTDDNITLSVSTQRPSEASSVTTSFSLTNTTISYSTMSPLTQTPLVDVTLVEINATDNMNISSSSSTSSYVTSENEVPSSSESTSEETMSVKPPEIGEPMDRPVNMSDFTDVCGRRMYPEARIVGGEKSSFGKWPWQISLRQWRTSTYLHKCGAALLNENWAITAAHCVDNVPPSDLLLRLGEHDLSTESEPYLHQERRVQIVASHPQFDPRTFEYDLALLRFYEPVNFQPNILPVCVPQTDENFVSRTAYVTGWGRLYEDGPLPSILQEVSVPVINNTVCESMYRAAGYIEHIPHIFICAGWRRGGFDSCEGDSGGPMVIQRQDKRFLLAGVISWGIGCAEPNQPGVYTRISEFRDWINQILQF